jgi:hypothetical protein
MPKIFGTIDTQMKIHFAGKRTKELLPELPSGVVEFGEKWVESEPIVVPDRAARCYIRGKFDTVLKFDDDSYAVIDFKTSARRSEHIPLYSRQLHAYAYALENAAPGSLSLTPVRRLGLLVYEPTAFSQRNGSAALTGALGWIEVARDDTAFMHFLGQVLDVLELEAPPPPGNSCEWCKYREQSRARNA